MSAEPRKRRLEVEEIGDVTVVNFVDRKILDEQKNIASFFYIYSRFN